jgi:hypothetical protein
MVGLGKYILLFFTLSIYSQQHVLIGDSQTYYLSRHSTKIKRVPQLSQSGIGVLQLTAKIRLYPVSPQVNSVSLCIGVNDGYKDRGVKELLVRTKNTFPNAKIFIIQGSWGWGRVVKSNQNTLDKYYKQYIDSGCILISPSIGKGDPHRNKIIYKIIMKSLEDRI